MPFYQLRTEQFIKTDINTLWDFISSPENLKSITPEYMGFDITSDKLSVKMYEGMIISYKVSPLFGIKATWVTEITHISEKEYFVDEQRVGPYKFWHHQHLLSEMEGGTMMQDIVSYSLPYGIIGSLVNKCLVRIKLNQIFNYRRLALEKIFRE